MACATGQSFKTLDEVTVTASQEFEDPQHAAQGSMFALELSVPFLDCRDSASLKVVSRLCKHLTGIFLQTSLRAWRNFNSANRARETRALQAEDFLQWF